MPRLTRRRTRRGVTRWMSAIAMKPRRMRSRSRRRRPPHRRRAVSRTSKKAKSSVHEEEKIMAIVRVDPFREFATLQDRVNRLFGNAYLRDEDVNGPSPWTPPVDIYETDGRDLIIKAEIPDLTKEAIEVTVANDTLTLR